MHHPTDKIAHATPFVTPVVVHWLEREIAQWGGGAIIDTWNVSIYIHMDKTTTSRSYEITENGGGGLSC